MNKIVMRGTPYRPEGGYPKAYVWKSDSLYASVMEVNSGQFRLEAVMDERTGNHNKYIPTKPSSLTECLRTARKWFRAQK